MKTVETFIYVGGSLGLVGGHDANPRLTFVRLSDYMELDAKVRRMAMDSLHDITHIADLKAEVERLRASTTLTAVPCEVYERSVEQYNSIIDQHLAENARLKAEVERLNDAITRGASIPDAKPLEEDQK